MKLDGTLTGATQAGPQQRAQYHDPSTDPNLLAVKAAGIDPAIWQLDAQPGSATLALSFQKQETQPFNGKFLNYSPQSPDIYFGHLPEKAKLRPGVPTLVLSPDLVNPTAPLDAQGNQDGGFGQLAINNGLDDGRIDSANRISGGQNYGSIFVPKDVSLKAAPGSTVTFDAGNIDVEGSLSVKGGTIALTSHAYGPQLGSAWIVEDVRTNPTNQQNLPKYNPVRGNILVGPDQQDQPALDAAGLVVDDRLGSPSQEAQMAIAAGGKVTLRANSVILNPVSSIDVSGGLIVGANGKPSYGNGGAIALVAGQDPTYPSIVGGRLLLTSKLFAYSGAAGGKLTLQAPAVEFGGTAPASSTLWFPTDQQGYVGFFNQGGFSSFSITGLGVLTDADGVVLTDGSGKAKLVRAVDIAPKTVIAPVTQTRYFSPDGSPIYTIQELFGHK